MANVVTIGTIESVTSATAGTIKPLSGSSFSYSDATISTRSIVFALGDYVICIYDAALGTTTGVTPLSAIHSQGLTDANSGNAITAASIRRTLRINNACASYKGAQYLEKFEKGIPTDKQLIEDADLMTAMIDSITDFVPEDEYITGRQATYLFQVTGIGNPALNMDVTITVGSATYVIAIDNTPARTTSTAATDIAAFINSQYPQNYSYYAIASGTNVVIAGSNFATSNSVAVSVSVNNGTITAASPNTLAGGVAATQQGENGITNEEVQKILDKLNKLCHTPAQEFVNLDSE